MTVLEAIARWAQRCPDRPAMVSGGRGLSYGELWRRSDELAAVLLRKGPADKGPVVVRGHKEPEMLVAFLAAVKAGRPYVPVDQSIPEERVARIIASSGARTVLDVRDLSGTAEAPPQPLTPEQWVGPDDTFYIIYTSGSTGEPKGVQITRGCLDSFLTWMGSTVMHPADRPRADSSPEADLSEANGSQDEVFLNQAPFSFDLSVMDLYLSLVTGGTLFCLTKQVVESPRLLFPALAASGLTTWVSTPSFAVMCLAEPSFDHTLLSRVRRFLFCGETLPPDAAARLLQRFPGAEVWNTYGPTEATVATTAVRVDEAVLARYNPLPVGYPKPDAQVLVVDGQGKALPAGERGEVVIVGPNVSPGYLNNPEQTARAFFRCEDERAYRTGDWGRYQDGLLFFEGRMDFQIKLHGYRIELGDIEAHLRALPGVEDAVVLPAMRSGQPEWLAAFLVLSDRPEGSDFQVGQMLRQSLAKGLPTYMCPRKYFFLASFPMTPNGKADRRKLGEMLT